jgi:hypothetical protein
MKVAIPTDDAIHIHPDPVSAENFLVFTIQLGEIIEEKFFRLSGKQSDTQGNSSLIPGDWSYLILPEMHEEETYIPTENPIKIYYTRDSIITKIIWSYLNDVLRKESNSFCCP